MKYLKYIIADIELMIASGYTVLSILKNPKMAARWWWLFTQFNQDNKLEF